MGGLESLQSLVQRSGRMNEDDYSATSSKTSKPSSLMGASIEKHSESIIFLAKTVAAENEKNRQEARAEQEKIRRANRAEHEKSRIDSCVNEIRMRINSLRDSKRNMVLRMAEPTVASNNAISEAFLHEVKGIEDEIAMNEEELNSLLSTPKKSNQSPQG